MHIDVVLWSHALLLLPRFAVSNECQIQTDNGVITTNVVSTDGDCACANGLACFTIGSVTNYGCAVADDPDMFQNTKYFDKDCPNCKCEAVATFLPNQPCDRTTTNLPADFCCNAPAPDWDRGTTTSGAALQLQKNTLCEADWLDQQCSDTSAKGEAIRDWPNSIIKGFCDTDNNSEAHTKNCLCCDAITRRIKYGLRNPNKQWECKMICTAPESYPLHSDGGEVEPAQDNNGSDKMPNAILDLDPASEYFNCKSNNYEKSSALTFKCAGDGQKATWVLAKDDDKDIDACTVKLEVSAPKKTEAADQSVDYSPYIAPIAGSLAGLIILSILLYYFFCRQKQLMRDDIQVELAAPVQKEPHSPRTVALSPPARAENAKKRWRVLRMTLNAGQKLKQDMLARPEVQFLESKFSYFARQGTSAAGRIDEAGLTIFFIQAQPSLSYRDAKKLSRAILKTHPEGSMSQEQFIMAYKQEYRTNPEEVWSQLSNLGYKTPSERQADQSPGVEVPSRFPFATFGMSPNKHASARRPSDSAEHSTPTAMAPSFITPITSLPATPTSPPDNQQLPRPRVPDLPNVAASERAQHRELPLTPSRSRDAARQQTSRSGETSRPSKPKRITESRRMMSTAVALAGSSTTIGVHTPLPDLDEELGAQEATFRKGDMVVTTDGRKGNVHKLLGSKRELWIRFDDGTYDPRVPIKNVRVRRKSE